MVPAEYRRRVRRTSPDVEIACRVGGPRGPTYCTSDGRGATGGGGSRAGGSSHSGARGGGLSGLGGGSTGGGTDGGRGTLRGRGSSVCSEGSRRRVRDGAVGGAGEGKGVGSGLVTPCSVGDRPWGKTGQWALQGRSGGQKSRRVRWRFLWLGVGVAGGSGPGAWAGGVREAAPCRERGEAAGGGAVGPRRLIACVYLFMVS